MKPPTLKVGRKYSRDPYFYGVNTCDPFTVLGKKGYRYIISNGYSNNEITEVSISVLESYLYSGNISLIKNKDIGLLKVL